jgi:hypothetical protein
MAKIILNPMVESAQGKMGNIVFRRAHTGEMTITKLPDMSKVKWSKAQKAQRQRFKQAVDYAKAAMADQEVSKVYQTAAAKQGKRPFDLAVSDYFKGKDLLSKK